MPQVHFIGEVEGATDFEFPNLYCKWSIMPTETEGDTWDEIGGEEQGQTQVDMSKALQDCVWAHPFDVHYACSTYVSTSFDVIFQVFRVCVLFVVCCILSYDDPIELES